MGGGKKKREKRTKTKGGTLTARSMLQGDWSDGQTDHQVVSPSLTYRAKLTPVRRLRHISTGR